MTEFNHDEWVNQMVESGQMVAPGEQATTPGADGEPVSQPDFADESVAGGGDDTRATQSSEDSEVEVKYIGRGAYEAAGVEVSRHGQTVTVDGNKANTLTGLQDDEGNALFERV